MQEKHAELYERTITELEAERTNKLEKLESLDRLLASTHQQANQLKEDISTAEQFASCFKMRSVCFCPRALCCAPGCTVARVAQTALAPTGRYDAESLECVCQAVFAATRPTAARTSVLGLELVCRHAS